MAFTTAQKEALEKAIASGVTRVTYDGNTTEYRSLNEMREVLSTIVRELSESAGTPTRRQVRVYSTKGL